MNLIELIELLQESLAKLGNLPSVKVVLESDGYLEPYDQADIEEIKVIPLTQTVVIRG